MIAQCFLDRVNGVLQSKTIFVSSSVSFSSIGQYIRSNAGGGCVMDIVVIRIVSCVVYFGLSTVLH